MQLVPLGIPQDLRKSSGSTAWSHFLHDPSLKWKLGTVRHNNPLQVVICSIFLFLEKKSCMGGKMPYHFLVFLIYFCFYLEKKKKLQNALLLLLNVIDKLNIFFSLYSN